MTPTGKDLRLFIAVPVSIEVKERAAGCLEALAKTGADARWAEPAKLHLTLRFLGATPESKLADVEWALDAAAGERHAFDLVFTGLGAFPSVKRPRIVWAGIGEGAQALTDLADALETQTERAGFSREERAFKAHLTLGRLLSLEGAAPLVKLLREYPPFEWRMRVHEVVLYASQLSPSGAVHTPLSARALR